MFFFAAFYFFIRLLDSPAASSIFLTGLCAGLALLSKFTCIILPPLLIFGLALFFFTKDFKNSKFTWLRYAAALAAALLIALLVLNASYGFDGFGRTLRSFNWRSGLFIDLKNSFAGGIPLPLPHLYLDAFDLQFFSKSKTPFVFYLNGELSRRGWPGFYWAALLLKTPIPLLLASAAALAGAFRRGAGFKERILWLAPAAFLLVFTFFVRVDLGFRYLLPIVPFMIAAAAGAIGRFSSRGRAAAVATILLCLWYGSSIFTSFGNGLAYFNEIAGGPAGGSKYLVESDLDWGQNLVRLKDYLDRNRPGGPLLVSNYGLVPPSVYGIKSEAAPCQPARALIAVSVNYLKGIDPFLLRRKDCFDWLSKRKPAAVINGGLYIYDTRQDK